LIFAVPKTAIAGRFTRDWPSSIQPVIFFKGVFVLPARPTEAGRASSAALSVAHPLIFPAMFISCQFLAAQVRTLRPRFAQLPPKRTGLGIRTVSIISRTVRVQFKYMGWRSYCLAASRFQQARFSMNNQLLQF
jgi:hypothetical protein